MRAIACWPIQYLTAFGIASQSPGYFPKAVYIATQMNRKRIPPTTSGHERAADPAGGAADGRASRAAAAGDAERAREEPPEPVDDEEDAGHVGVLLRHAGEREAAAEAVSHAARSVSRNLWKARIVANVKTSE